jgi:two-component system CheB/CheR fusion protein
LRANTADDGVVLDLVVLLAPFRRPSVDGSVGLHPTPDAALAVEVRLERALAGLIAHRLQQRCDSFVLPLQALKAVLVPSQDFRVKAANKSFYTIFNATEEETEGKLFYELGNRQWDILPLRRSLETLLTKHSSVDSFYVEHDFPQLGRKIMLVNAKAVIQQSSKQQLILVAIEDITEHKQKEELLEERETWFRNMANQAPVMIWVSGSDRRKNFFNDTWLQYTGRKNGEEQGIGWRKQIHIDDIQRYLEVFNDSYEKQCTYVQEYRLRRADGEYRWVLEIGKPIIGSENSFSGFIGSCTEIHDKKILNEELEQRVNDRTIALKEMNQELERSNVELQQFAYVASHDLQEPLRKNLIYADRLLSIKEELPPSAASYIDKIMTSSERMRNLIEELLEFSKISKENKFELTNLHQLVQKLLSDFEIIIKEKNATLTFDNLPIIKAVPVQMEQLFHNLISNALKFSKANEPPQIQLSSHALEQKAITNLGLDPNVRYVEIVVSDKGIGFSENYKEKIFEIFHRLNSKQDYPGTGIGLALCRKIVNNHGGKIFAESAEMEGTKFHIILPYQSAGRNLLVY